LHGLAAKDATSFPQPIGLGATFNPALVESLYAMAAYEARVRGTHQALTPVHLQRRKQARDGLIFCDRKN
jgi:beta-glucosidase